LDAFEKRGIQTNIPLWSSRSGGTLTAEIEQGFKIAEDGKTVTCPEGNRLTLVGMMAYEEGLKRTKPEN
tara:strand:+ start:29105 stop:29311 length:207 start_codon:yes stop_codon:yes gene_type:complete